MHFVTTLASYSCTVGTSPFARVWRSLRWTPIPLSVGFAYITYQHIGHIAERDGWKKGITAETSERKGAKVASAWQVCVR